MLTKIERLEQENHRMIIKQLEQENQMLIEENMGLKRLNEELIKEGQNYKRSQKPYREEAVRIMDRRSMGK